MGFIKSKRFVVLSGILAFLAFTDLYIFTASINGLLQIMLWVPMMVVAFRFDPNSSFVMKFGRGPLALAIAILIGTFFIRMSQVVGD